MYKHIQLTDITKILMSQLIIPIYDDISYIIDIYDIRYWYWF